MEIGASMMAEHVLTCPTGTPVTEATSVVAETIIECLPACQAQCETFIHYPVMGVKNSLTDNTAFLAVTFLPRE